MTTISLPAGTVPGTAEAGAGHLSVRIADTLVAVEQTWRRLESEAEASPYQRFDWVSSYAATCLAGDERLRIAILEDAAGRPAMLLPLILERRHGLKVASPLGGKHANFNLPLMRPGFAPEPGEARALLARIGREIGADLVVSHNAPVTWRSTANPLAAGGQPSPSNAYKLTLSFDAEATLARVSSGPARKKLRSKERGLAKLGAASFLEARSEAEVDRILSALWLQKSRRFQELGISDPYGDPAAQDFVRRACLAGLGEGRPAIELHALLLDDEIVAAFGGAADDRQLSGMFISFDSTSETAKYSPGEILVAHIVRGQCERGRTTFDLGVGEARYKRIFCDEVEQLADMVVAVTAAGRLYGRAVSATIEAKRRLKASPRAMRLLAWTRRMRATRPAVAE
jgi:CelD/BcsL family acetyltransferase involved in cellulose biosynthesis